MIQIMSVNMIYVQIREYLADLFASLTKFTSPETCLVERVML